MSDLFHKKIPTDYIDKVFSVMETADRHIYQILTKRSSLMEKYLKRRYASGKAPPHVWCGVSIEDEKTMVRLKHLQKAPAAVRFLSFEPLLGPIGKMNLAGISWVIVGGESGPKARPMEQSWVIDIKKVCEKKKIPFFFKQWGGRTPKAGGRLLEDREWSQFPSLPAVDKEQLRPQR